MATIKEELLVSGMRQVAVTCRRGTSVARSLKLLALPYFISIRIEYNIILSTNRSYVISPCVTNNSCYSYLVLTVYIYQLYNLY